MRRPTLAVIGDGTVEAGSPTWGAAFEVGRLAVEAGMRVMTGGLGGVMAAASQGARAAAGYHEGDVIGLLPGLDPGAANPWVDIAIATGLDHARNSLVANADAVVAVGGGAGTLSELSFAWIYNRLIVALALPGWSGELAGRRLDARPRNVARLDDAIFAARDAAEAIAIVKERLPDYPKRPAPRG